MSKSSAVACAMLLLCSGSRVGVAQDAPGRRPLRIGPVANVSFATFTGSDVTEAGARTLFSAGAAATISLGPSLFLQPQALYSMKGANATIVGGSPAVYSLAYVELPLLLGYRFSIARSSLRPFVVAGPTVAFERRCKGHLEGSDIERDCNDNGDEVKTNDTELGFTAGGGIEVPVGGGVLGLTARYSRGFTDIADSPSAAVKVRNAGFSVGLGWSFSIGR